MNFRTFFHYLSYLQYPLILTALYFAIKPYILGLENFFKNPDLIFQTFNSILIFIGLAMSFSSLQDTTKTQNKFSEKIWKNPRKGKVLIAVICVLILSFLIFGLVGYYFTKTGILNEIAIGAIILGLGMFGFLKAAIEMFENHRMLKNS